MTKSWMAVAAVVLFVLILYGTWCLALFVAFGLTFAFLDGSSPPEPLQYLLGTFAPAIMYVVSQYAFRRRRYGSLFRLISVLLGLPVGAFLVLLSLHFKHTTGNPGAGVILVPFFLVWSATLLLWAASVGFKALGKYLGQQRLKSA